jgi:hypothetical protein
VRWIEITSILAVLVTVSADARDAKRACLGLHEEDGGARDSLAQEKQLQLTDKQCEAAKKQELRVPLFEIPQDGENPMALSLGAKQGGGILRFKISFSF